MIDSNEPSFADSDNQVGSGRRDITVQGLNAMVTGGSRGIGAGVAHELAAAGARVVVIGGHAERLAAVRDQIVADGGLAEVLEWDIRNGDSAAELITAAAELTGWGGHPGACRRESDPQAGIGLHCRQLGRDP